MEILGGTESGMEKEFRHLKGRIKTTRKSRIEASKRLRKNHNFFYEKVSHFYSLIVLILSVWFLNQSNEGSMEATKILLVLSLTLTYFTMFLSLRNYKERAGNFETNYQQLDVLTNKIDRFNAGDKVLSMEVLKEFQREYEKLIIGKENHINMDYYLSDEDNQEKFKKRIITYRAKEGITNFLVAIYPLILVLIVLLFSKIIEVIEGL